MPARILGNRRSPKRAWKAAEEGDEAASVIPAVKGGAVRRTRLSIRPRRNNDSRAKAPSKNRRCSQHRLSGGEFKGRHPALLYHHTAAVNGPTSRERRCHQPDTRPAGKAPSSRWSTGLAEERCPQISTEDIQRSKESRDVKCRKIPRVKTSTASQEIQRIKAAHSGCFFAPWIF
ncbi:hypothetical protein HPB47_009077 [Ixodes persulcatus]|uniref:Uncharacterized protein n=1 Tax=Ixodes persulcatus TaxID=34615 RepID=A0AC60P324_IXOPE|nr:hypothetical protein HPB47_009077 [Ixodes persulcatus]